MATQSKWKPFINVNLCFEINGERKCLTLNNREAFYVRNTIEKDGGVVWWFSSI